MEKLTREQLAKDIVKTKQELQLILVNRIFADVEHLANKTIRKDYEPSYIETQKILQIKRYVDKIVEDIS